jgi:hypothetical protein
LITINTRLGEAWLSGRPETAAHGVRLDRGPDMTHSRQQARTGNSDASPVQPPFGSFETISKSMQSQFATLTALPQAVIEANLTIGSELYAFLGRRMKAEADFCHELSRCNEVEDALEAQRRFSSRATSDYSAEMTQMSTLLRKELASVASETVAEAGKAAKLAA